MLRTLLAGGLIGSAVALTGCASDKIAIPECEPVPVVIQQEESHSEQLALPSLFCLMQDEEYIIPDEERKSKIEPKVPKEEKKPFKIETEQDRGREGPYRALRASSSIRQKLDSLISDIPHPTDKGYFTEARPVSYNLHTECQAMIGRHNESKQQEGTKEQVVVDAKEQSNRRGVLPLKSIFYANAKAIQTRYMIDDDTSYMRQLKEFYLDLGRFGDTDDGAKIKINAGEVEDTVKDRSASDRDFKKDENFIAFGIEGHGEWFWFEGGLVYAFLNQHLSDASYAGGASPVETVDGEASYAYLKASFLPTENLLLGIFGTNGSNNTNEENKATSELIPFKQHRSLIGLESIIPLKRVTGNLDLGLSAFFREYRTIDNHVHEYKGKFGGYAYTLGIVKDTIDSLWAAYDDDTFTCGLFSATRKPSSHKTTIGLKGAMKEYMQMRNDFSTFRIDLRDDQKTDIFRDKFYDIALVYGVPLIEWIASNEKKVEPIDRDIFSLQLRLAIPITRSLLVGGHGRYYFEDSDVMAETDKQNYCTVILYQRISDNFGFGINYSYTDSKDSPDYETIGAFFRFYW